MDLAAAERDRPYITGFLRAPLDFPGIIRRIFVHSNAKKPDRNPPTARPHLVICDSLLRRYAGEMMTRSLFPLARGLAILFGFFAAGCNGNPMSETRSSTATATATSATPPVNMADRWRLASARGGACGMTFAAPAPTEGTIAPEGGCPAKLLHQPALGLRARSAGDPGSHTQTTGRAEAECSRALRGRVAQWRSYLARALTLALVNQ
jgi:hypothetical protein